MTYPRLLALATLLTLAPASRAADKTPRTVEMALTADGLAPSEVRVTKGETVRLAITRKTDKTCMTEVVVEELGVRQALPLGKAVYLDLTPSKSGSLRILCGMGMEFGKIVVN